MRRKTVVILTFVALAFILGFTLGPGGQLMAGGLLLLSIILWIAK